MFDRVKNAMWILGCALILTPSFFVNNGTSHDWGGDFALYIQQAINIVDGVSQTENGYIYNAECLGLGPKTYPIGFPIILSPIYSQFGNDMTAFIDYMAILGILLGISIFLFARKGAGPFGALIIAVGICYHPSILEFKREVMSDIPFALLCLMFIALIDGKRWWWAIPVLILASITRTVGITLFISLGLLALWNWRKSERPILAFLRSNRQLWVLLVGIGGYLVLYHLVFETASETGYRSILGRYPIMDVIQGNLTFYSDFLQAFLFGEHCRSGSGQIGFILILLLTTIGWFRKSFKQFGVAEIWLPVYFFVLIIYPYRGAGLRFMLPILPLLFYYVIYSFKNSNKVLQVVAICVGFSPFFLQAKSTYDYSRNWPEHVSGPQSGLSQELFAFVRSETSKDASFLFIKPRVLALYTGRSAMSNERNQEVESIKNQLDSIPIQYLLHAKRIRNPGLVALVETYPEKVEKSFENPGFVLYRYIGKD